MDLKCMICVGESIAELNAARKERRPAIIGELEDAITLAPSWQQKIVAGQLVVACVAIPVCLRHIKVDERLANRIAGSPVITGLGG